MTYRSLGISTFLSPVTLGVAFLAGCFALTTLTGTVAMAQVSHSTPASANLNLSDGIHSSAGDGSDTFQFLEALNYRAGGAGSRVIAVADFNGDGIPDAVLGNLASENVTIFIGRGDGVFKPTTTYNIDGVLYIVAADVNGDHKVDLLMATGSSVAVLLGRGDGTFTTPATFGAGNDVYALAVADLNGDGIPDIATASNSTGAVSVLLGNGDGTFRAPVIFPSNADSLWGIAVADFNGDGKPDIAVSGFVGGVMLGNGDGSFQPVVGQIYGGAMAVGDLNGDGKLDVLLGAGPGDSGLGIFLGNGDGTFTNGPSYNERAVQLALADVNNDGNLDVVFTGIDTNLAGVLLGNGDGTLQAATYWNTKRYGQGQIAAAEVDGNGKPDVLLVDQTISQFKNPQGGWLTVFRNNSGSPSNTLVATSGSPSHAHQPVTFTATVSANGGPAPDGDLVRFYKKGTLLGSVPLKGGAASLTTSKLPAGTFQIKATYIGDKTLQYSSATVAQVVQKP
jgi:hypothetical protein